MCARVGVCDSIGSEVLTQCGASGGNVPWTLNSRARMHNSYYYREQAEHYRQLAASAADAAARQEFLELAAACVEVADKMDDCRASG